MRDTDTGNARQEQQTKISRLWSLLHRNLALKFSLVGRSDLSRRLSVVETLPLGGKRQLLLVTCEGGQYLIGLSGDGVQTIHPIMTRVTRRDVDAGDRT